MQAPTDRDGYTPESDRTTDQNLVPEQTNEVQEGPEGQR